MAECGPFAENQRPETGFRRQTNRGWGLRLKPPPRGRLSGRAQGRSGGGGRGRRRLQFGRLTLAFDVTVAPGALLGLVILFAHA